MAFIASLIAGTAFAGGNEHDRNHPRPHNRPGDNCDPVSNVPDGGTTLAMMSASMLALCVFARRSKKREIVG